MRYEYITENTCARKITFDMEGNVVRSIVFEGGCNGNLKAIAKLLEGATVEEIVKKLAGNTYGRRPTSCTDQLAIAVKKVYNERTENV